MISGIKGLLNLYNGNKDSKVNVFQVFISFNETRLEHKIEVSFNYPLFLKLRLLFLVDKALSAQVCPP